MSATFPCCVQALNGCVKEHSGSDDEGDCVVGRAPVGEVRGDLARRKRGLTGRGTPIEHAAKLHDARACFQSACGSGDEDVRLAAAAREPLQATCSGKGRQHRLCALWIVGGGFEKGAERPALEKPLPRVFAGQRERTGASQRVEYRDHPGTSKDKRGEGVAG